MLTHNPKENEEKINIKPIILHNNEDNKLAREKTYNNMLVEIFEKDLQILWSYLKQVWMSGNPNEMDYYMVNTLIKKLNTIIQKINQFSVFFQIKYIYFEMFSQVNLAILLHKDNLITEKLIINDIISLKLKQKQLKNYNMYVKIFI